MRGYMDADAAMFQKGDSVWRGEDDCAKKRRPDQGQQYYTTSQLARRWSVSPVTVIRLIEQGDLNGLKIRGCYRICRGSIMDYESRVSF